MASIHSTIKKAVSPVLGRYGFAYAGKPDSGTWRFSKEEEGVVRNIDFVKSYHAESAFRVEFSTSVEPVSTEVYHLMDGARPDDGWWHYADEQSLFSTLEELVGLAVMLGLPYLETVIRPVQIPPPDVARCLLDGPGERARSFCIALGIETVTPDAIDRVDTYILNAMRADQTEDWEPLLGAAAFLGEVFRQEIGGEWMWDDGYSQPIVGRIGGVIQQVFPLLYVCRFSSRRNPKHSLRTVFTKIAAM